MLPHSGLSTSDGSLRSSLSKHIFQSRNAAFSHSLRDTEALQSFCRICTEIKASKVLKLGDIFSMSLKKEVMTGMIKNNGRRRVWEARKCRGRLSDYPQIDNIRKQDISISNPGSHISNELSYTHSGWKWHSKGQILNSTRSMTSRHLNGDRVTDASDVRFKTSPAIKTTSRVEARTLDAWNDLTKDSYKQGERSGGNNFVFPRYLPSALMSNTLGFIEGWYPRIVDPIGKKAFKSLSHPRSSYRNRSGASRITVRSLSFH